MPCQSKSRYHHHRIKTPTQPEMRAHTSGNTEPSRGLPIPSRTRKVGMVLSRTALKKSSLDTMGEFVVGKTSCRRVEPLENALDNVERLFDTVRIMEA